MKRFSLKAALVAGALLTGVSHATTFNVTNSNDSGPGSLRDAISQANNNSNGASIIDEITFDPSVSIINLTTGEIAITDALTINGGTGVTIDAQNNQNANTRERIFNISADTTLKYLTLQNGQSTDDGGAIYANANLTISNSTLSGNSAAQNGGAIYANANITITNSTLSSNTANDDGANLTISNSTLSGNSAAQNGGAIYANANLTVSNSTLKGNTANDDGGAIYANANITITNSTLTGNKATQNGGAIAVSASNANVAVNSSILLSNIANSSVNNCSLLTNSATVSGSNNLWEANNTCGSATATETTFAAVFGSNDLADNGCVTPAAGGCVKTIALKPNTTNPSFTNPAIDNGTGTDPDQRGFAVQGSARDIGAFESQGVAPGIITVTSNKDDNGFGCTLREAVALANDNTILEKDGCSRDTTGYNEMLDTIQFNSNKTINLTRGEIAITDEVVIDGDSQTIVIDAKNNQNANTRERIFNISADADTTIKYLTLQNGQSTDDGGAILANANLTIKYSTLSGNTARGGGAIRAQQNSSTITIDNSQFSGNRTSLLGGGAISAYSPQSLIVNKSTFSNNFADGSGGAILVLNSEGSTKTVTVSNSTFSSNQADFKSGALWTDENVSLSISNSTLAGNQGRLGAGAIEAYANANVTLNSNILLGNTLDGSPNNCSLGYGVTASGGNNLWEENNACGNAAGANSVLAKVLESYDDNGLIKPKLANNGCNEELAGAPGTATCVETIRLVVSGNRANPAINKGIATDDPDDPLIGNTITSDQRGRDFVDDPDIGAYESTDVKLTITPVDNGTVTSNTNVNSGSINGCKTDATTKCIALYQKGTSVELIATAEDGYQFMEWTGDCTGSVNPLTVEMGSDKVCQAVFFQAKPGNILEDSFE